MKLRYRSKLLFTFIVLSVVPLALLGTYSYIRSVDQIRLQTMSRIDATITQAADSIEDKLAKIGAVSEVLVRSRTLQVILQRAERGYQDKGQELEDYRDLVDLIESVQNDEYVGNVRLYIRPRVLYSQEGTIIFLTEALDNQEILLRSYSRLFWDVVSVKTDLYPSGLDVIQLTRSIPDLHTPRRALGALQIDVRMDLLEDVLKAIRLPEEDRIVVLATNRFVASSPSTYAVDENAASFLLQSNEKHVLFAGESFLISKKELSDAPWTLVALSPVRILRQSSQRVAAVTVLFALGLLIVDGIVAFLFSRLYTRRLDAIVHSMGQVRKGNYGQLVTVEGNDEITELQKQHNSMVRAIHRLVKKVADTTSRLKEAQFKALEAQINPHFLYNTLESMKWMAARKGAHDIVSVLEALSGLYRFNLNRGKDYVSLSEEVRSVEDYVLIQNMRFGRRIQLKRDLQPDILTHQMIKMILQPLVENAIYHGIHAKEGKTGSILIQANKNKNDIIINVCDDGVGIPKDDLKTILDQESDGYGIKNVHQRIQLYYGPKYGLHYESKEGEGTRVSIRIPIVEHADFNGHDSLRGC